MLPCTHVHLNNRPRPVPKPNLTGRKHFAFPTKFSQQPSLRESMPAIRILTKSQRRASSHPSLMLWGGAGGGVEIRDHPLTTLAPNHATLLSRAPYKPTATVPKTEPYGKKNLCLSHNILKRPPARINPSDSIADPVPTSCFESPLPSLWGKGPGDGGK